MQFIHRIIFLVELGGSARITGKHHFPGTVSKLHRQLPHLGEVPVDFLR
ncbi:MAG: hypothetical protein JWR32_6767 [Mycobacterium sp.]|jgi:hypothetical protein|nr:hypothetical protein [Mycobacterium sp.]